MVLKKKIEKVIENGGNVPSDKEDKLWKYISVRFPKYMVDKLDKIVKSRPGSTRIGIILEYVLDGIKREQE